eukprot:13590790-Heterocapsa_arctica.AAC.1
MESLRDALSPMDSCTFTSNLQWRKPKRAPLATMQNNGYKPGRATLGKPWKPSRKTNKPTWSFGKKVGIPSRKTSGPNILETHTLTALIKALFGAVLHRYQAGIISRLTGST